MGQSRRPARRAGLRWLGVTLAVVLGLALIAFGVCALRIAQKDTRLPDPEPIDAAIVLGAAAHGGRPSPVFQARLDYGLELYRQGRVRFLIATGGGRDDPAHP